MFLTNLLLKLIPSTFNVVQFFLNWSLNKSEKLIYSYPNTTKLLLTVSLDRQYGANLLFRCFFKFTFSYFQKNTII